MWFRLYHTHDIVSEDREQDVKVDSYTAHNLKFKFSVYIYMQFCSFDVFNFE